MRKEREKEREGEIERERERGERALVTATVALMLERTSELAFVETISVSVQKACAVPNPLLL